MKAYLDINKDGTVKDIQTAVNAIDAALAEILDDMEGKITILDNVVSRQAHVIRQMEARIRQLEADQRKMNELMKDVKSMIQEKYAGRSLL